MPFGQVERGERSELFRDRAKNAKSSDAYHMAVRKVSHFKLQTRQSTSPRLASEAGAKRANLQQGALVKRARTRSS